jgi:hypothetical protein
MKHRQPIVDDSGPVLVLADMVGAGNDRVCWRHPLNDSLCVKVAKPEQERAQNDIDFHYGRYLARHDIAGPYVPRVHGWARTDHGLGLVVDMVQQPDGTPSPTLAKALRNGLVTSRQAVGLVDEAFDWLVENRVILADFSVDNILVRRTRDGACHLVFVDGLGARNFGIQYWARRMFGFKARKKTRQCRARTLQYIEKTTRPAVDGFGINDQRIPASGGMIGPG